MSEKYESFLNKFDEKDWLQAVDELLPAIHPVDRNAAQIWFRFYPLALHRHLQATPDKAVAARDFVMQGEYELKNQVDSSHAFLYGHRFWTAVKAAIEGRAEIFADENSNLSDEIRRVAKSVAEQTRADESLIVGIAAVGLMTLAQTGFKAFKNAAGAPSQPNDLMSKSPDQIVRERAKDDSQGLLGFLKTVDKQWTVRWNESAADGKFKLMHDEEIASGAARDQSQNWLAKDARCGEGVIPVECRSAACGTCWVGVLAGAEKLSDVAPRERKQMKVFGYNQPDEARPILRLACQARAHGAVSIVIPPWNGVFGKRVYGNVAEIELEPATTSAVKLRETIRSATDNGGGK